MKSRFLQICAGIVVFGLCSCKHYVIKYPYAIYRSDLSYLSIVDISEEVWRDVISAHILEYAVVEEWIIGRSTEAVYLEGHEDEYRTPEGYFVFNMSTKERLEGMSESEFNAFLQNKMGLKEIPRMKEPDFSIW